jgi:hypothetical protein
MSAPAAVALIEEVTGRPAGVEFMDYLAPGKVIRLDAKDSIVLSYLTSCVREIITGGTITIGSEQSDVKDGKVERTIVKCDGGAIILAAQQADEFAGTVFRGGQEEAKSEPELTLFSASPMVELKGPGTLTIERLDRAGERRVINVTSQQLLRGRFYDLARNAKPLVAGGTYRASCGGRAIIFRVDPKAQPGAAPVVGRLLPLGREI